MLDDDEDDDDDGEDDDGGDGDGGGDRPPRVPASGDGGGDRPPGCRRSATGGRRRVSRLRRRVFSLDRSCRHQPVASFVLAASIATLSPTAIVDMYPAMSINTFRSLWAPSDHLVATFG